MTFSIFAVIIALIALGIAFFHYVQGFFSAALSAVIAVIAAVLAVSYHERIVESVMRGKFADNAHAMVLVVLFMVIYLTLRVIFDKAVPGNVRLPPTADKVGAAIMGLIAGTFAAGIIAIAAQELPLGQAVAGYTRYNVRDDQTVIVPTKGRDAQALVYNGLTKPVFDENERSAMLLPADDIVMATVTRLSEGGSLSGPQRLSHIHPDLLQELQGQRLGIQTGARRVALNTPTKTAVSVTDMFMFPAIGEVADQEFQTVRAGTKPPEAPMMTTDKLGLIVIRVSLSRDAADSDGKVRISPGSVRLVSLGLNAAGSPDWKNYYPVGTLEGPGKVYWDAIDDFLFVNVANANATVDFLFQLDPQVLSTAPGPKQFVEGTFLEVKRLGRIELGLGTHREIKTEWEPPENPGVMRKTEFAKGRKVPPAARPATAPKPSAAQPPAGKPAGGATPPLPPPPPAPQ